jgi:hypothetical protein
MVRTEENVNLSFTLPDTVVLLPVGDRTTLQQYKQIFVEAFQKTLQQTEQKF